MQKKLLAPLVVTSVGVYMFLFGSIWASQTGYDNPDPSKRDANIGAGLIGLAGLVIGLTGLIWLVVQFVASRSRK